MRVIACMVKAFGGKFIMTMEEYQSVQDWDKAVYQQTMPNGDVVISLESMSDGG